MIVIENKLIPFGTKKCMNICGILFVRSDRSPMTEANYNHEAIHTAQIYELFIIGFYLWYCIEYLIRRIGRTHYEAYSSISFEQEAYANQRFKDYLDYREPFSFTKYL